MARRWIIAIVIALSVPIVCFVGLVLARNSLDSQWISALYGPNGVVTDDERAQYNLSALCADPEFTADPDNAAQCVDMNSITSAMGLSVIVVGWTLLLVLGSLAVVGVTRGNRARMARLYRPALVVLLLGLGLLLLLQGLLLVIAAYEVPSVLFGEYLPILLLAMGIAVLAGIWGMLRAIRTMLRRPRVRIGGVALDPAAYPALFDEVRSIATAAGAEAPEVIMAGLDPSFFVVDSEVDGFDGGHKGRVLFLSLPYCYLLSKAELRAVVGHEVGHFRGLDTQYSKAFTPVYAASREGLIALYAAASRWSGIPTLPALKLLEAFVLSFAESEHEIGRQRELEADKVGAQVSSPEALATSLLKLSRTSEAWPETFDAVYSQIQSGRSMPDLTTEIAQRARTIVAIDAPRDRPIPHPFDSHPTVEARLEALGIADRSIVDAPLALTPEDPAAALFGDATALERSLNERYERNMRASAARIAMQAAAAS
jgi:Zn-dependent protease with chaperone function